ncbi:MAG: PTS sugar transporter subunit IIC [Planctomycetaceae bacterium]
MSTAAARVAARVTALADAPIPAAIRAGVVAVVPLTIVGGLFMLLAHPPLPALEGRLAPWQPLLEIPVTATFGLIGLFVCLAVAYDLAERRGQDRLSALLLAGVPFLMLALDPASGAPRMEALGSAGILVAILVAIIAVETQGWLERRGAVIRMPAEVPRMVAESFASLVPLAVLLVGFWLVRFVAGFDLAEALARLFRPLVSALDTLPGIVVYAFLVAALWSVGINGDNALDTVVGPVFLQYLVENAAAWEAGTPPPWTTAQGFFTTFANVGGTGATLALALVLLHSRDPATRKVARLSLPSQIFQINEPLFFGLPIVLNPLLMVPYVACAVLLTGSTWLLMEAGLIGRPVVGIPWTTPPVIGHWLVTGGDWRAALWGAVSIVLAMAVWWPFARRYEAARRNAAAQAPAGTTSSSDLSQNSA